MSGYRFDRLKILLVDDNPHMRRLVSTILQAWPKLREFNPDILVLDWLMGGTSGIELTKMIRTAPTSPNPFVPVIMLTGHTHIDRVLEARDAGVNEFLVKPISVNAMLSRLLAIVEHPRPFVRTKTYFGPCRRRRDGQEYRGPERRSEQDTATPPMNAVA